MRQFQPANDCTFGDSVPGSRLARLGMTLLLASTLVLCLLSCLASALDFPPLTGRVVDQAGVMTVGAATCMPALSGPGYSVGGDKYVITQKAFEVNTDVESEIRSIYGNSAKLTDWRVLKAFLSSNIELIKFIEQIGIPRQAQNGPCENFLVSVGGRLKLENGLWLFLARHDGIVPSNWTVLDSIDDHTLDLGRWFWNAQALVVIHDDTFHPPIVTSNKPPSQVASPLVPSPNVQPPRPPDKRIALVIGNSAYVNVPRLANPANDARLMADTLRSLGFRLVGGSAQLDLDKTQFDSAVQDFGTQLQGADVGLFYYAGHGVQVRGANYLVPVGADATKEADVDFQMLDTDIVLRQMEGAGTKLNIVILDACRNNPFGGRGFRGTDSGLAQMRAPEGTLISFATQPGNVAQEGAGGNSPYTEALALTIRRPGLGIFRCFQRGRAGGDAGHRQCPTAVAVDLTDPRQLLFRRCARLRCADRRERAIGAKAAKCRGQAAWKRRRRSQFAPF